MTHERFLHSLRSVGMTGLASLGRNDRCPGLAFCGGRMAVYEPLPTVAARGTDFITWADNTSVKGLGDLGSALPAAFDEAFVGYKADFCADWKHICNYVMAARKVLCGLDADAWAIQMKNAIWDREPDTRDWLLAKARKHRQLDNLEPKATLRAIIHEGDWDRFQRSELAAEQSSFAKALQARLHKAVTEGRLGHGVMPAIESAMPASAKPDTDLPQVQVG